ncbi:MAG: gliding motility-associated C-terminal domain-containing protein, partial [Polaribacter sp.]|nr:gliding motility-associated C-terminal domain-containing protein [Polaribacter sp.]
VNVLRTIPALTSSINQTVNSINDKLNEDTETFILQATTNLDNVSNTFFPSGVGTLKDNDFPNLFSPNGDGKSDVFKISGIVDSYPNFKISIYNRQGNEVFKYSNNGNTNPIWWDGTYNGKPVATGVYFYTLEYNDGVTKPKTNFIQLIR